MIAMYTSFCVIFVTVLMLKKIYQLIFCNVVAPALCGNIDFKKQGKWAVVTGATDGVGKAYAEALAKRGMDIVLISRTQEKLESVASKIKDRFKVDTKIIVADFAEGNKIVPAIEKELFDLDIGVLVNNVGLSYDHPEYFLDVKGREKFFDELIQVNIFSLLNMCQIVMPAMVEKKRGVVINISSASALFPSPLLSVYAASKMFVSKFSEDLAAEYKNRGILVQCVLPGYVSTKMSKIRRPTFLAPSPEKYVESALSTVGIESHTLGYWPHNIVPGILISFSQVSQSFVQWSVMRSLNQLRVRAHKRDGK